MGQVSEVECTSQIGGPFILISVLIISGKIQDRRQVSDHGHERFRETGAIVSC